MGLLLKWGSTGEKHFPPCQLPEDAKRILGMPGYIQKITKGMANKIRKQKIRKKGILQV